MCSFCIPAAIVVKFNDCVGLYGIHYDLPYFFFDDYLERQSGFVICTTNLAGNFDEAFERRFLFKIKFEKPDLDIQKKIWKNKVTWLNKKSVEHLASSYALSGAEIDNVVRKVTIKEVLTGKRSSVVEIEDYCQKEKFDKKSSGGICFSLDKNYENKEKVV